jgi:hypothetical protein
MEQLFQSQNSSTSDAEEAVGEEGHTVSAPPPPTAIIPALNFGLSEGRSAVSAASTTASGNDTATVECLSHNVVGSGAQWTRQQRGAERSHSASEGAEEVEEGNDKSDREPLLMSEPPALRRPSALFDTAQATEALFARLRQQQQERVPPPPPPARPTESETTVRRPSVPISSILGRPPTAPIASAPATAGTSTGAYPYSYPTPQRELSASSSPRRASSSFRGHQRSASPTSTVDYVDIEHKQSELRYAVEHHIQSLERALALRDEEVAALTSRLRKLEEDYQFNYNLIAERDAALEEAAAQLQRLYRELKRLTEEAARTGKKVDVAEAELKAARHRVREVEEERNAAVRQLQKDYAVKERHLFEGIRARESALEEEQKEQHQWYKEQVRLLEEERTALADRSVSISMEADERCKQQVGRLQSELTALQRELKAARQTKADDDRRIALLEEAKVALSHDMEIAQERHEAFVHEANLAKKEVGERLTRVTAEAEKRTAAAESATREENARASRLELERTRLQAMLSEAQERLQHLKTQYDDDIARYTKERQTLLQRNDDAVAATAAVEQSLQDTQRELEKQRRLAAEEAERLGKELERSHAACEDARQALVATQEKCEKLEAAGERLEAEVRRWKSEEDRTATSGRQERSALEEKCRQAERQLQLLQEESQQAAKLQQSVLEKAQGEAQRLTRELHASEAARRTLEDQFHLLEEYKAEGNVLPTLRMEKEQLQRRVTELEHTNEEVRQQVAAFTAELQNDPILKAAKESQQRVVDLQQELAEAKADQQLLRDTVKEKEDEIVRYQTEVLRVQVLMGGDEPSAALDTFPASKASLFDSTTCVGLSDQVSRALQRQQQQMRSEYSKMRQSYEEMVRELDRQRRHRRRHRASAAAVAPRSRSSSVASSSSSSASRPSSTSLVRGGTSPVDPRKGKQSHRQAGGSGGKTDAPLPPVLPDSKTAFLVQETEVWRQRCTQLEQQLRTVLLERDRLRKELQLAKQDAVALGTEKQSLIDLNSLLKAQLREAYRMRIGGDGATVRSGAAASSSSTTVPSPSKNVQISPELLAAALRALEEGGGGHDAIRTARENDPQRTTAAQGVDTAEERMTMKHNASAGPNRGTPMVHSTHGCGTNASAPSTSSATTSAGAFSTQAAQQRLAALEREIDDVRGQLSYTAATQQTRQPVVRRGNAAVRHYGYGN